VAVVDKISWTGGIDDQFIDSRTIMLMKMFSETSNLILFKSSQAIADPREARIEPSQEVGQTSLVLFLHRIRGMGMIGLVSLVG
jgi:hypothetical protein